MNKRLIEKNLTEILEAGLGLDMTDPNLVSTPHRIAKMWTKEFFSNIGKKFYRLKLFPNTVSYDQIILLDKIFLVSTCSHHFLPFVGYAWFAYIPKKYFVGASKPARLFIHHSKKPQLQEQLGHEVLNDFVKKVKPLGAALIIKALHGCMSSRGVKQSSISLITSCINGAFGEPSVKQEFLDLIQISLLAGKI